MGALVGMGVVVGVLLFAYFVETGEFYYSTLSRARRRAQRKHNRRVAQLINGGCTEEDAERVAYREWMRDSKARVEVEA